jgi:hypothetical protein
MKEKMAQLMSEKEALDPETMRQFITNVMGGPQAFTELCVKNRHGIAGHFDRRPTLTDE